MLLTTKRIPGVAMRFTAGIVAVVLCCGSSRPGAARRGGK
jgi:hypothetical protein